MPSPYHKPCNVTLIVAHRCAYHATNTDLGVNYTSALLQNAPTPHGHALVEIYDFVTNEFVTSCDYLTFTTIVGYIYNYCLHLKPLATTL
jgi:hypothetical protein